MVWYVVEELGTVSHRIMTGLEHFVEFEEANRNSKLPDIHALESVIPVLTGLENSQKERLDHALAMKLKSRLQDFHFLRDKGPRHHMQPDVEKLNVFKSMIGATPASTRQKKRIQQKKYEPLDLNKVTAAPSRTVAGMIEERGQNLDEDLLLKAKNRILVVPESMLYRPRERLEEIKLQKKAQIKTILTTVYCSFFMKCQKYGFCVWLESTIAKRDVMECKVAIKMQCYIRRWLCKNEIRRALHMTEMRKKEKWQALHDSLGIVSKGDYPQAITIDNKIYFRFLTDLNRYCHLLRVYVNRFVTVMTRKKQALLVMFFSHWLQVIKSYRISDLTNQHIRSWTFDAIDDKEILPDHEAVQNKYTDIITAHKTLQGLRVTDPASLFARESDSFTAISAVPLGLGRDGAAGEVVPPWHPSIGITNLPTLPVMPFIILNSKIEYCDVSDNCKRFTIPQCQEFNSFRQLMEGPTADSCWVIPGRIIMVSV